MRLPVSSTSTPTTEITAWTPYDQLPEQLTVKEFCAKGRMSRAAAYRAIQDNRYGDAVVRYGRTIRILKRILRDGTEAR